MRMALAAAADCIEEKVPGVETRLSGFANRDGTLDAQLSITEFPLDVEQNRVLIRLENCVEEVPGTWISIILRYGTSAPKGSTEAGDEKGEMEASGMLRYRGLMQIETYPRRNIPTRRVIAFHTSRLAALRAAEKNRSLVQVLVRLYWSPSGKRPHRQGF